MHVITKLYIKHRHPAPHLFMACVPACIAPAQAAALPCPSVRWPAAAVKNRLYNWNTHEDEHMSVCVCVCKETLI